MKFKSTKFHFIGIGGVSMSGLAELLFHLGAKVSGSDLVKNTNTERLERLGVSVFQGHNESNLTEADVVVYTSILSEDNPEVAKARRLKIPLIPRAEALAEIMRLKRGIAIGGTHGKTTTTSMISSIFIHAQQNPTIMVGGKLDLIDSTASLGSGDWMISEADESDGSFLQLSPEISVITNIDDDHLDFHKSFENLKTSFFNFALKTPFYGAVIACGDDKNILSTFKNFPKKIIYYGFESRNDFVIIGQNQSYELFFKSQKLGMIDLPYPGRHTALNAAAAIIAGLQAGLSFEQCQTGIRKFKGVDRRFQFKGEKNQVVVYDDYGHHPTEIKCTLSAFREKFPEKKITVYFQPHRFSRTQLCWNDFKDCFIDCDQLWLGPIYSANEKPIDGINSENLIKTIIHKQKFLVSENNYADLFKSLTPGSVFITLGAGDGWKIGKTYLG